MPRKRHEFDRTTGEVQELFEKLVSGFGGQSYDNSYAKRLLRIKVDGVPLRDVRAERQTARSIFYAKEYLEAQEVANMLVQLGLDEDEVSLERRDRPDIAVRFVAKPSFFVEQRSVFEPGMPFSRHLEQATHALEDLTRGSAQATAFLTGGTFQIRLVDPGPDRRRSSGRALAREALALIGDLSGKAQILRPDEARFPTLSLYGASASYHPGGPPGTILFQREGGFIDREPPWVRPQLVSALAEKRRAAAGYDPRCRPLWLLLTMDSDALQSMFARDFVADALAGASTDPFDRVVVRTDGAAPVVIDG